MECIVKLLYDKEIVIGINRYGDSVNPSGVPYICVADGIAKKYSLRHAGFTSRIKGFSRPKRILSSVRYSSNSISRACDFAEEILTTKISLEKIADRVEISIL